MRTAINAGAQKVVPEASKEAGVQKIAIEHSMMLHFNSLFENRRANVNQTTVSEPKDASKYANQTIK